MQLPLECSVELIARSKRQIRTYCCMIRVHIFNLKCKQNFFLWPTLETPAFVAFLCTLYEYFSTCTSCGYTTIKIRCNLSYPFPKLNLIFYCYKCENAAIHLEEWVRSLYGCRTGNRLVLWCVLIFFWIIRKIGFIIRINISPISAAK